MTDPPLGLADVYAHLVAGKRLLASAVDSSDYEWQRRVGSWYIAADALLDAAATQELREAFTGERVTADRNLSAVERFRLLLLWLELKLRADPP